MELNINETCIKYLGIQIDANLGWKPHINYIYNYIGQKIKRGVGVLSKVRYEFYYITSIRYYFYSRQLMLCLNLSLLATWCDHLRKHISINPGTLMCTTKKSSPNYDFLKIWWILKPLIHITQYLSFLIFLLKLLLFSWSSYCFQKFLYIS